MTGLIDFTRNKINDAAETLGDAAQTMKTNLRHAANPYVLAYGLSAGLGLTSCGDERHDPQPSPVVPVDAVSSLKVSKIAIRFDGDLYTGTPRYILGGAHIISTSPQFTGTLYKNNEGDLTTGGINSNAKLNFDNPVASMGIDKSGHAYFTVQNRDESILDVSVKNQKEAYSFQSNQAVKQIRIAADTIVTDEISVTSLERTLSGVKQSQQENYLPPHANPTFVAKGVQNLPTATLKH